MRNFKIIIFLFIGVYQAFSQGFYDIGTIQDIRIVFTPTNWDYMLDTAKAGSEGYIVARTCTINGVNFDSVGVKYKGNSSYNANNVKNPLHIELDHIKGKQDYEGYTDIKLGNGFSDPSMIREVLSYEILRNYMHAPLSNFAKVYINGTYMGLYSSSEDIGKSFCGKHFYSTDNSLFKCNPVQVSSGTGAPDLKYLGTSSASYTPYYELQTAGTWDDLIHLCDTLNNKFTAIEQVLDIDRAIWMLAFNNVLVNLDSYTGSFRQNYYLYKDDNARINPIVWDLNMSFGGFPMLSSGAGGTGAGALDTTGMKNMSITANSTSTYHPLIQKILGTPQYKKMYIAHIKTITQEMLSSNLYYTRAQALQSLINAAVTTDNNKFYTNTQFATSLTTNITGTGPGGRAVPGIRNLIVGRMAYYNSTSEFGYTAPTIANIQASNNNPALFSTVYITAAITNTTNVYIGYRKARPAKFTKTPMFDDGAHGDGAANDGVFGAQVPIETASVEYYIYAENNDAGMFSPQRAEHEFYTLLATVPTPVTGSIVINEFVAQNQTGAKDANGDYEDWVELYNNTSNPISLKNMYLSDLSTNPNLWKFPDYAVIPPNDYVTVWCDNDEGQSGYHTNFKLSSTGGFLILNHSTAGNLENITFTAQTADLSVGRCANGTGTFKYNLVPSFGTANNCAIEVTPTTNDKTTWVQVYPNPAQDFIHIQAQNNPIESFSISDMTGRIIFTEYDLNTSNYTFQTENLPNGMYIIQINHTHASKLIITH